MNFYLYLREHLQRTTQEHIGSVLAGQLQHQLLSELKVHPIWMVSISWTRSSITSISQRFGLQSTQSRLLLYLRCVIRLLNPP